MSRSDRREGDRLCAQTPRRLRTGPRTAGPRRRKVQRAQPRAGRRKRASEGVKGRPGVSACSTRACYRCCKPPSPGSNRKQKLRDGAGETRPTGADRYSRSRRHGPISRAPPCQRGRTIRHIAGVRQSPSGISGDLARRPRRQSASIRFRTHDTRTDPGRARRGGRR